MRNTRSEDLEFPELNFLNNRNQIGQTVTCGNRLCGKNNNNKCMHLPFQIIPSLLFFSTVGTMSRGKVFCTEFNSSYLQKKKKKANQWKYHICL